MSGASTLGRVSEAVPSGGRVVDAARAWSSGRPSYETVAQPIAQLGAARPALGTRAQGALPRRLAQEAEELVVRQDFFEGTEERRLVHVVRRMQDAMFAPSRWARFLQTRRKATLVAAPVRRGTSMNAAARFPVDSSLARGPEHGLFLRRPGSSQHHPRGGWIDRGGPVRLIEFFNHAPFARKARGPGADTCRDHPARGRSDRRARARQIARQSCVCARVPKAV
jgi:hypothetical protein